MVVPIPTLPSEAMMKAVEEAESDEVPYPFELVATRRRAWAVDEVAEIENSA